MDAKRKALSQPEERTPKRQKLPVSTAIASFLVCRCDAASCVDMRSTCNAGRGNGDGNGSDGGSEIESRRWLMHASAWVKE